MAAGSGATGWLAAGGDFDCGDGHERGAGIVVWGSSAIFQEITVKNSHTICPMPERSRS